MVVYLTAHKLSHRRSCVIFPSQAALSLSRSSSAVRKITQTRSKKCFFLKMMQYHLPRSSRYFLSFTKKRKEKRSDKKRGTVMWARIIVLTPNIPQRFWVQRPNTHDRVKRERGAPTVGGGGGFRDVMEPMSRLITARGLKRHANPPCIPLTHTHIDTQK